MVDSSQGLRFQGKLTYAERNEITSSLLQEQKKHLHYNRNEI